MGVRRGDDASEVIEGVCAWCMPLAFEPILDREEAAEAGLEMGLDGEIGTTEGPGDGHGLLSVGNVNTGMISAGSRSPPPSLEDAESDGTSSGRPPYTVGLYDTEVCSAIGISRPVPMFDPELPRDLERKRGGLRYIVAGSGGA